MTRQAIRPEVRPPSETLLPSSATWASSTRPGPPLYPHRSGAGTGHAAGLQTTRAQRCSDGDVPTIVEGRGSPPVLRWVRYTASRGRETEDVRDKPEELVVDAALGCWVSDRMSSGPFSPVSRCQLFPRAPHHLRQEPPLPRQEGQIQSPSPPTHSRRAGEERARSQRGWDSVQSTALSRRPLLLSRVRACPPRKCELTTALPSLTDGRPSSRTEPGFLDGRAAATLAAAAARAAVAGTSARPLVEPGPVRRYPVFNPGAGCRRRRNDAMRDGTCTTLQSRIALP